MRGIPPDKEVLDAIKKMAQKKNRLECEALNVPLGMTVVKSRNLQLKPKAPPPNIEPKPPQYRQSHTLRSKGFGGGLILTRIGASVVDFTIVFITMFIIGMVLQPANYVESLKWSWETFDSFPTLFGENLFIELVILFFCYWFLLKTLAKKTIGELVVSFMSPQKKS